MPNQQIWLITGASAGLGRAVTEHVLAQGDIAVATCRKPEALSDLQDKYDGSQLLVIQLDVTKHQDIEKAFLEAKEKLGRIDVVYSNAGYGIQGEVEAVPEETARQMFEVNFWGAINVTKEAMAFFRNVNKPAGGRLLVASSFSGTTGLPTVGVYTSSKAALDNYHEALSKELSPNWNIKITLAVLGMFVTRGMTAESMVFLPPPSAYIESKAPSISIRKALPEALQKQGGDARKAARELYNLAADEDANFRVPIGLDSVDVMAAKAEQLKSEVEIGRKWSRDLKLEV